LTYSPLWTVCRIHIWINIFTKLTPDKSPQVWKHRSWSSDAAPDRRPITGFRFNHASFLVDDIKARCSHM
jgi:hypothetical protein